MLLLEENAKPMEKGSLKSPKHPLLEEENVTRESCGDGVHEDANEVQWGGQADPHVVQKASGSPSKQ